MLTNQDVIHARCAGSRESVACTGMGYKLNRGETEKRKTEAGDGERWVRNGGVVVGN
jgi:hypothetical protein